MPNPRNLERLRRIQTLAASGMTKSQIARELDISLTTILHYERSYGVAIKKDPRQVAEKTMTGKPWTEEEESYLAYALEDSSVNLTEVAEALDRTVRSVDNKIQNLRVRGLVPDRAGKQYTTKEIAYLIRHYGKMTSQELAEQLGRSVKSIQGMASRLGLSKPNRRDLVEQVEALIAEGYYLNQIAKRLGVSHSLLIHYERTRGLSIPRESPEARAERVKDNMTRFWARGAVHYTGRY